MPDTHAGRTSLRSRWSGSLRGEDVGSAARLAGWVHRRRDLGSLVFVNLRDREGIVQVSFGPEWTEEESLEVAKGLKHEQVVAVEGEVVSRPSDQLNPEMDTGEVEVRAVRLEVLGDARTPAISVYRAPEEEPPSEELRLRHRVLDLRRPELQEALRLRHELVLQTRNYLSSLGFLEIETPILTRPTPEGARDYLVPSRVHPGEFYALPQSPQIYKQILMVSGFDRYFQIARCFRDEDLRSDRQPEFTQIDVEASFVSTDDVLGWMEGLMNDLAGVAGKEAPLPIPRMTWAEAMDRFGTDRPDLRWSMEIRDISTRFRESEFRVLSSAVASGGRVRALLVEGGAELSRKDIDGIEAEARKAGAPGLLWVKRSGDDTSGSLARWVDDDDLTALGIGDGDLLLVAAGEDRITSPALDAARRAVVEAAGLPPEKESAWLWVTDFPVFEEDHDGRLVPNHHPFVMPHPDDMELLDEEPLKVRGQAYDLVYNGTEFGSGSIRIHRPDLQRKIFGILGLSGDETERKFGFLLNVLEAGAPPHGGIAFGVDRIVQRFSGLPSIRDVIAFPKTTAARALFEGAPTAIPDADLAELGIRATTRPTEGG